MASKKLFNALAMMVGIAQSPYGVKSLNDEVTMSYNPNHVHNPDSRSLREFSINGRKVTAYSRKDAIKRLKHQKAI